MIKRIRTLPTNQHLLLDHVTSCHFEGLQNNFRKSFNLHFIYYEAIQEFLSYILGYISMYALIMHELCLGECPLHDLQMGIGQSGVTRF
jgi:hypothetical protein